MAANVSMEDCTTASMLYSAKSVTDSHWTSSSVTLKRKDNRKKPLDQCTVGELEQMLEASKVVLCNTHLLDSLPDKGESLKSKNKDILMWLEKRRVATTPSQPPLAPAHSQSNDEALPPYDAESRAVDILIDEIDTQMQQLNMVEVPLPVLLTKSQVRDLATQRQPKGHGRIGQISLTESISIQETQRQIVEAQRLRDAMERLRKSAGAASMSSLSSEFFQGAGSSASLGEFATAGSGVYREANNAYPERDFDDDLSDLSDPPFDDDE
ncbi:hypothetical protein BSLG_006762 [Batrachochytrium salamandrivorans]|nr:hypothetical protein BSLG_006762 [Batrachochytrium salamandrivorans]